MTKPIYFKQVSAQGGCNSFILADPATKAACIVDPRVDEMPVYEDYLVKNGLKPTLVVDTHTHADHYSGSHLVAEQFGSHIAMGRATASARPDIQLREGQPLEVGSGLGIDVLETPGHTPDSVSLLVRGAWGSLVLTGDTLFIGGSGRTDFPGADAGQQFDSIHGKLAKLDDSTWVLPGHDYSSLLTSTIGQERRTNPHLLLANRDEFIRLKQAEALESGGVIPHIVDFNIKARPTARPRAGAHTMCATAIVLSGTGMQRHSVQETRDRLASRDGTLFVDVREPEEFAQSRIEGMVNIPLSELFLHWNELRKAKGVSFFCQQGNRSIVAAQSFSRLGLSCAADVTGGLLAWIGAGFPVKRG